MNYVKKKARDERHISHKQKSPIVVDVQTGLGVASLQLPAKSWIPQLPQHSQPPSLTSLYNGLEGTKWQDEASEHRTLSATLAPT